MDLLNDREHEPWGGYDFSKPSFAVICVNEYGDGMVLWSVGGHIKYEISEAGRDTAEELGLDLPSAGIWIWEGKYIWHSVLHHPDGGVMDPVGEWHEPTYYEWQKIMCGHCPWDDNDWKLPEERVL